MSVPLVRRSLFHDLGKLLLSAAGVGAALSLILLLMGFRQGLYSTLAAFADNLGAGLIVAQSGVKGILSSDSAIPLAIHDEAVRASGAERAGQEVMQLLCRGADGDRARAVVVVTHDHRIREMADRILWLEDGRLSSDAGQIAYPVAGDVRPQQEANAA